jgi:hypothetical protein
MFSCGVLKRSFSGLAVHFHFFSCSRPKARDSREISSSSDDLHNDVNASVLVLCYFEWVVRKFS